MAFNDVITQDGIGWVWLVDVSLDNFATVSYRWSDRSVVVGSDSYQARIPEKGLSKIHRGFGTDHTMKAGTVTLTLDNTDFGVDWLVEPTTVASQVLRARFKLTLLVYANGATPGSGSTKVCGTFKCLDFPVQDRERVTVQLADDTMGLFDQPLTSPTIREWQTDAGSTLNNCPIHSTFVPTPYAYSDWDSPIQLAWGDGKLNATLAAAYLQGPTLTPGSAEETAYNSSPMLGKRAIVVCATTSTDDVVTSTPPQARDDVRWLWGVYREDALIGGEKFDGAGKAVSIPKTFTLSQADAAFIGVSAGTKTIWEPKKTQTITKDGASWRILWVLFDVAIYSLWYAATHRSFIGGSSSQGVNPVGYKVPLPPGGISSQSESYAAAAFSHFQVQGMPYSARTNNTYASRSGAEVIRDLIVYYSKGSASDFDETRFAIAQGGAPTFVNGVVLPQRPPSSVVSANGSEALVSGRLREAIFEIAETASLDVAMTWEGKIAVHSTAFSFANLTATRVALAETRENDVVRRIPSKGERWAPYNRLYLIGPDGKSNGPFDNPHADAVAWSVKLERTLRGKWLRASMGKDDPLYTNSIWQSDLRVESVIRPVIRFLSDRDALQLDLGDLFDFKWTRGGANGPYNTAAVFRVESMAVDPETLTVGIEAVWVDDTQSTHPYLLDTEELTVRVRSTSGRTATVTDSIDTIDFSSGNLTTDGVTGGDIIRLKDSSQALNVFTRYRDLLVGAVLSATQLQVDTADLDFDAPAPVAVTDWEIRRGATTYPDSSSDPTNYPSDGDMYGKACDDSDDYSDATEANLLL